MGERASASSEKGAAQGFFAPVKREVAEAAHDDFAQVRLARGQRAGVNLNLGGNLRPAGAREAQLQGRARTGALTLYSCDRIWICCTRAGFSSRSVTSCG